MYSSAQKERLYPDKITEVKLCQHMKNKHTEERENNRGTNEERNIENKRIIENKRVIGSVVAISAGIVSTVAGTIFAAGRPGYELGLVVSERLLIEPRVVMKGEDTVNIPGDSPQGEFTRISGKKYERTKDNKQHVQSQPAVATHKTPNKEHVRKSRRMIIMII